MKRCWTGSLWLFLPMSCGVEDASSYTHDSCSPVKTSCPPNPGSGKTTRAENQTSSVQAVSSADLCAAQILTSMMQVHKEWSHGAFKEIIDAGEAAASHESCNLHLLWQVKGDPLDTSMRLARGSHAIRISTGKLTFDVCDCGVWLRNDSKAAAVVITACNCSMSPLDLGALPKY